LGVGGSKRQWINELANIALFAERDFKTRNQKQRTGWGLVQSMQRSRALSEGEAETPMGAAPMDIPHFAIQSAHHLKFKTQPTQSA
jgi:hypothetical protein